MKKILLDTNAYSLLLQNNTDVYDAISEAETTYMSIFVLAELYAGFLGGNKKKQNESILNNFLKKTSIKILNTSTDTAEIFAKIKYQLKKSGSPIPINDIWIAAHCIEYAATIITFDSHFKNIHGLLIWDNIKR